MRTVSSVFAFIRSWCLLVKSQVDPGKASKAKSTDKLQIVGLVMVTFVTARPGQDCNTVCKKKLSDLLTRLRRPVTARTDFLHMLSSHDGHQVRGNPKLFFIDECLFYRRFCIGVADVWIALTELMLTVRNDVIGESVEIRMKEMERLKSQGANVQWSHSLATEINSWASFFKICMCERILYIPQVRVAPTYFNIAKNPEVRKIHCGPDAICQRLNEKFFAVGGNEWFCKKGIRVEDIPVSKKHPEYACACSALYMSPGRPECLTNTDPRVASIRVEMGPDRVISYQSSAMYEGTTVHTAADSGNFPFARTHTSIGSSSGTTTNHQQDLPHGVSGLDTGQDLDNMSWLLFDSQQMAEVAHDITRHQEANPESITTGQSASFHPTQMDFAAAAGIASTESGLHLSENELVELQSEVQTPFRSTHQSFRASERIRGQSASNGLAFARFAEGDQMHFQNNFQMQLTSLDAYPSFIPPPGLPAAVVQHNIGGLSNSVEPTPHTHGPTISGRTCKIPELKRKRDAQSLPLSRHLTREFDPNRPELRSIETLQQSSSPLEATLEGFDWLLGEGESTRSRDGLEAIVGPFASSSDISRVSNQNDHDGTDDTKLAKGPFQYDFL